MWSEVVSGKIHMCGCGCGVVSSWSLGCASVWDVPSVMSRDTGDMDGFGTIFKSQWWEKDTVSDLERVTLGLSTQMKPELRKPKTQWRRHRNGIYAILS